MSDRTSSTSCAAATAACARSSATPHPAGCRRTSTSARATPSRGEGLPAALEGVRTLFYLIHSMEGRGGDFAARDREAAVNVGEAARDAGVERIVYLGGLGAEASSEHLRSRAEVAELLRARVPELIHARAAMIIGPGSASFEILKHLTQRLPLMIAPRWLSTRTQPIAIADVARALADLGERDDAPAEVELGGPEALSYRDMISRTASVLGRRSPAVISVPLLTPRLSSYWIALVTPVEFGLVRPLVDGLKEEMLVDAPAAGGDQRRPDGLRRRRPGGAGVKLLNRRREQRVADAVIRDPEEHTTFDDDGGVRSIQAADLTMPEEELDAIWSPMHLERLARTYWKYLSRVTLGLIRVVYTPAERAVVFIGRPFVLLRFDAPKYTMDADHGIVRWQIKDGILVASTGREKDGYLEIDITRCPEEEPGRARLHVEVEIASFYPGAGAAQRPLALREHPVAHPRARHARVPALARAARARGVGRRPVRRPAAGASAGQRRRHAVGGRRRARRARWRARSRCSCGASASRRRSRSARAAWCGRGASAMRRTVPERERITSDSVLAPRWPS